MLSAPRGIEPTKLHQMVSVCACLNARRLARLLSRLYDAVLRQAGVRMTQLPFLAAIGWYGPLTLKELAQAVVIDRTTLTRSRVHLERKGWVRSEVGADRRTRKISLTPRGWGVLRRAIPLWERAQARVAAMLGDPGAKGLVADLAATINQMKNPGRASARLGSNE